MPKRDTVLGSQEQGGPDKRLDLINLVKEADQQEAGFHHKLQAQQEARDERKLSEGPHTRANESFKDCNCWTCGARGHISTNCPENEKRGIRSFEPTPDIEEAVYYQDLVQVYQFEDIPSDESIYEEEEVFSQEEDFDGESESESD